MDKEKNLSILPAYITASAQVQTFHFNNSRKIFKKKRKRYLISGGMKM